MKRIAWWQKDWLVGHLNFSRDVGGAVRSEPLVMDYHSELYPSLSLMLVARSLNLGVGDIRVQPGALLPLPVVMGILARVADALEAILARALAKAPEQRYASGAELAQALRDCAATQPKAARDATVPAASPDASRGWSDTVPGQP